MGYLISINNQQSGPFSLGQLKSLIQKGQITLNYLICQDGSNDWIKIDTMPELKAVFDGSELPPVVVNVQSDTTTVSPPIDNKKLRHGFIPVKWIVRIQFFALAIWLGYYKPGGYIIYPWLPTSPEFFPFSHIVGFFVMIGLGIWLSGKVGGQSK